MFGAPGICSKPNSEHLPGNSEHLDALRGIARLVGSVRKAPKKVAYRSRGAQAKICEVRRFGERRSEGTEFEKPAGFRELEHESHQASKVLCPAGAGGEREGRGCGDTDITGKLPM
jgi:hypothetical protein